MPNVVCKMREENKRILFYSILSWDYESTLTFRRVYWKSQLILNSTLQSPADLTKNDVRRMNNFLGAGWIQRNNDRFVWLSADGKGSKWHWEPSPLLPSDTKSLLHWRLVRTQQFANHKNVFYLLFWHSVRTKRNGKTYFFKRWGHEICWVYRRCVKQALLRISLQINILLQSFKIEDHDKLTISCECTCKKVIMYWCGREVALS